MTRTVSAVPRKHGRGPAARSSEESSPRWARRKDARPHELLDAALAFFVERGYAATRLDDVAARAGVSKGTLYLYYASKQDLFEAVVRYAIVERIRELEEECRKLAGSPEETVRLFFDRWWTMYGSTPSAAILKLLIGEAHNFPHIARFFRAEVVEPNMILLARIIAGGVVVGDFETEDPVMTAHLWLAPLVLKSIWTHSFDPVCGGGSGPELDAFRRAHVDHALASVRPVRASSRRR